MALKKNQNTKCGFVAVVGNPNVGKSTLVNALTGQKVTIVTPKPQTTRNRIRAIRVYNETQMIFVDTPGIFKVSGKLDTRLNRSIVQNAVNAFDGVDIILFVVDSKKILSEDEAEVLRIIKECKQPKVLVLNKVDITNKEKLLELSARINSLADFDTTFMISSTKNQGLEDILKYLEKHLPKGQFFYPEDELSDMPMRLLAAEITREKLFLRLSEEIPYTIMVETETFEEKKDSIKINQSIYTISEAHKKIIIGKNGEALKNVGIQARKELTRMFEKKVSLFLFVKVRSDWMDKKDSYTTSGMDYSN